jgi:hypothetical protein
LSQESQFGVHTRILSCDTPKTHVISKYCHNPRNSKLSSLSVP